MSAEAQASEVRWEMLARAAARRRDGDAEAEERVQERVREIVRVRPVTPLPRVPPEVLGVISLRGEIVQVVHLRRRLGLGEAALTRASRVVVVHGEDGRVAGLLVDAVNEVMSVTEESLRPPPGEAVAVEFLSAQGERFVSLLDLDRVLAFDGD